MKARARSGWKCRCRAWGSPRQSWISKPLGFDQGWDLVLMDSFIEVQADVKDSTGMTSGQAEKWLLDLMYRHNLGNNSAKTYTSFIAIQQVNKGGNFVAFC